MLDLTPDGLRGMRLIVYIGMLADRGEWDPGKLYQIPAELAATVDRYQTNALDARQWIQNRGTEPLRPMIILQGENRTIPSSMVIEFIRSMKVLLSRYGNLQRGCILCRKQLPSRWMVVLCMACEHKLVGGGGRESLTWKGIECIYLLHQLVENIHSRRLQGDYGIPSIMVDPITEGRIRSVLTAQETPDDWWLLDEPSGTSPVPSGVPPIGGPRFSPC